jgi:hypothetical protein
VAPHHDALITARWARPSTTSLPPEIDTRAPMRAAGDCTDGAARRRHKQRPLLSADHDAAERGRTRRSRCRGDQRKTDEANGELSILTSSRPHIVGDAATRAKKLAVDASRRCRLAARLASDCRRQWDKARRASWVAPARPLGAARAAHPLERRASRPCRTASALPARFIFASSVTSCAAMSWLSSSQLIDFSASALPGRRATGTSSACAGRPSDSRNKLRSRRLSP